MMPGPRGKPSRADGLLESEEVLPFLRRNAGEHLGAHAPRFIDETLHDSGALTADAPPDACIPGIRRRRADEFVSQCA